MEKTLHEKKVDIKKTWEECFKIKMEDKLTEEGIKKFWSDDFTIKECFDLLTEAGIDHVAGKLVDDVLDEVGVDIAKAGGIIAIAHMNSDDVVCEYTDPEEEATYKVQRGHYLVGIDFKSVDAAREFIERDVTRAKDHSFSIEEYHVLKVID